METAYEKFYGVAEGVSYQQQERVEDLNERISSRQFPDRPLEPNYTPRSVPTKYSHFPIIDRRKQATEQIHNYAPHDTHSNFNPGSAMAPIKGFLENINTESVLRNQTFSKQRFAENVYVPTTKSDLYNVIVPSKPSMQPYPLLFTKPDLDKELHANVAGSNIGRGMFFNSTRVQLRNGW
jgi:hypothetical protein